MDIKDLRTRAAQANEAKVAAPSPRALQLADAAFPKLKRSLEAQLTQIADRGETKGTFELYIPAEASGQPPGVINICAPAPAPGVGEVLAQKVTAALGKMGISGSASYDTLGLGGPPTLAVTVDFS